jgi:hypothetical protein
LSGSKKHFQTKVEQCLAIPYKRKHEIFFSGVHVNHHRRFSTGRKEKK